MKITRLLFLGFIFTTLLPALAFARKMITADHTVLVTNYSFTPSQLTIVPGETVAFINVEGLHSINGINNTVTGESFNNPVEFFLPEVEGAMTGVLMGEITFDVPGTYHYDCSIGFHAQLGMVGTIEVDAFTVADLLGGEFAPANIIPDVASSSIAFNSYLGAKLDSIGPWTVFLPNEDAVDDVLELINLNQFDLLAFYDLAAALEYHVATGLWMAEDLEAGLSLPTLYGQSLSISEQGGIFKVDDAAIVSTNYIADNGVVHVIDKCLAPSGLPKATVWDIIKNSDDHQLLETAILNTYLDEELRAQNDLDPSLDLPGPFTIFAPTDAAFEAYSQALGVSVEELLAGQYIDDIVKTHLIGSRRESADLINGQQLQNYLGEFNQIAINNDGIFIEGVPIQTPDIKAYNGVVHVIDEIIAPNLYPITGSCGTWTLVMQNTNGEGWDGSFVEVKIDGQVIGSESLLGGYSTSFQFGVDVGAEVTLNYAYGDSGSSGQSYKLFDSDDNLIFNSNDVIGGIGSLPFSVYGLRACAEESSCGLVEIEMLDDYGDGWDFGKLNVFINNDFYRSISMEYGYGQKAYIPTEIGDVLDFNYLGGVYTQENSFIVYGPDGEELANQFDANQTPESVTDIVVCENVTNTDEQLVRFETSIFPNPTTNILNIRSDIKIESVAIISILGQRIYEAAYPNKALDVSFLGNNAYVLEVKTEKGLEYHQFSILR